MITSQRGYKCLCKFSMNFQKKRQSCEVFFNNLDYTERRNIHLTIPGYPHWSRYYSGERVRGQVYNFGLPQGVNTARLHVEGYQPVEFTVNEAAPRGEDPDSLGWVVALQPE